MKSLLQRLTRTLFIAGLVPLAVLTAFQNRLLYHPRPYPADWLQEFAETGGIRLAYTTSEGGQTAFYRPPTSGISVPRRLWLCFTGNGSLALEWEFLAGQPHPDDALLMVDYPGYGLCAGSPTPARIQENAVAALKSLVATKFDGRTPALGLAGHSLGAAAALLAAQELTADRLLLLAPFTSLMDMADHLFFPPLGLLVRHRYDNLSALAQAKGSPASVLIFHGELDEVIPVAMGRRLAESQPATTRFIAVPDATHNDVFEIAGRDLRAAMNAP